MVVAGASTAVDQFGVATFSLGIRKAAVDGFKRRGRQWPVATACRHRADSNAPLLGSTFVMDNDHSRLYNEGWSPDCQIFVLDK